MLSCFSRRLGTLRRIVFFSFASSVAAQNLAVPLNWVNTTSNLTRESREGLANGAAATFLSEVNVNAGASAGLPSIRYFTSTYAVLSLQDYYSGNSTWSTTVFNGMQNYYQQYGLYGVPALNNDPVYWGLAFFYAYRTYRQQFFLDLAMMAHNLTYTGAFITSSAAASGTGAGRNVSFSPPSGCTNTTIAGGVFFHQDVLNDTTVNAETITPFMALSAYLFEQTNEQLYSDAAELSLNFVINHLWNGVYVQDSFVVASCQTDNTTMDTFNQAFFVEGLSVWANVTKNSALTTLLESVISNVTTFKTWSLPDGVIDESKTRASNDLDTKGVFVRGLTEARMRNPGTDLAKYIDTYTTVQFNSVINNALATGTNFYAASWSGPAVSSFNAAGSLAAVDVLNAAFSIATPSASSASPEGSGDPSTTSPAPSKSGSSKSSNAGVIAGSVVGGVVAVAAIVGGVLFLRRRRHRRHAHAVEDGTTVDDYAAQIRETDTVTAEPFMLQTPFIQSPTKGQRLNAPQAPSSSSTLPQTATTLESSRASTSAHDPDAMSEPVDNGDLPNLVRRLYSMLHGPQGEPPPQYEN
ncbi:hypothetical protein PENSPDRAFT_759424 [Peniophora sp. CONT]|nr:hypothetical protein PENSPDRAFT_759424 [Peniophora sp. CONT]